MPFHDKIADFLDDVVPNEIKPYLGTAVATAIPFGGGIAGGFLGGAATDILMQKLLYGSDEDRDTDYLSAGMSGILGGLRNVESGFLGGRDPQARRIDTTKPVPEALQERLKIPTEMDPSQFGGIAEFNQAVIDAGGAFPATKANPANYFKSDFLKGVSDFATPFQFKGAGDSATPIRDIIGETTSTLGMLQLGQTPSQVRDAKKALQDAERRYQEYLNRLDEEQAASAAADMAARVAAYKEYMGLAGFTNAEIDTALMEAGYLASGETAFSQGGRVGMATGGRIKASDGFFTEMMDVVTGKKQEEQDLLLAREFFVGLMQNHDEDFARRVFDNRYEGKYNFDEFLNSGLNFSKGGRVGFATGSGNVDDRDEIAFEYFGKKYIELDELEREAFQEVLQILQQKTREFNMGGRVGFDTGGMTDSMGLGNYMEAEKVRTEFTDKIKRMLQAKEMNMKMNDPGLMRFANAMIPGGEGFYTREEMRFPSLKSKYESILQKFERDQAKDDYEREQIRKQMQETRKSEFDDIVNMIDDRFSDNRQQRKKANTGGRMTPEGDPISPDVPPGMQMDLRPGGFIPLGTAPKADDVPAMVGKNEFVLNDEAVSGIGKLITGKPDPRAGARALYKLQDEMEAIV